MKIKLSAITVFALFTLAASCAYALPSGIEALGFKVGDDVNTVKVALHTTTEPEPMERNPALPAMMADPNKGKTVLHLRTKGIWVFFSPAGKVDTIRLDAPFSGAVMGIKLGDAKSKITSTLGNPIKKPYPTFITMEAYQYVLDDTAYVTFGTNDDGVQYILVTK
jgi:hypothetical protein